MPFISVRAVVGIHQHNNILYVPTHLYENNIRAVAAVHSVSKTREMKKERTKERKEGIKR